MGPYGWSALYPYFAFMDKDRNIVRYYKPNDLAQDEETMSQPRFSAVVNLEDNEEYLIMYTNPAHFNVSEKYKHRLGKGMVMTSHVIMYTDYSNKEVEFSPKGKVNLKIID